MAWYDGLLEHLAGGGGVYTPDRDDGDFAPPSYDFQTPPPHFPGPPAQVYGKGGGVEKNSYRRFFPQEVENWADEDEKRYRLHEALLDQVPHATPKNWTAAPRAPEFLSDEADVFRRHLKSVGPLAAPLTYGAEALARLDHLGKDRHDQLGNDLAGLLTGIDPRYRDQYGLAAAPLDALSMAVTVGPYSKAAKLATNIAPVVGDWGSGVVDAIRSPGQPLGVRDLGYEGPTQRYAEGGPVQYFQEGRLVKSLGKSLGRWLHGTAGEHTTYDANHVGSVSTSDPGLWFTKDPKTASQYAQSASSILGGNPRFVEADLRAERPLFVRFKEDVPFIRGRAYPELKSNYDISKWAQAAGHDAIVFPHGNFSEDGPTVALLNPKKSMSGIDHGLPDDGFADGGPVQYFEYGNLVKPNRVSNVLRTVRNAHGSLQGARMEQAGDLTNLDRISTQGLMKIFDPKQSGLLVAMPTDAFEDYAPRLPQSAIDAVPYPRWHNVPRGGRTPISERTQDEYLRRMGENLQTKGMHDAPSLWMKSITAEPAYKFSGPDAPPLGTYAVEHEGRHRMRTLNRLGDERGLVNLLPANGTPGKGELGGYLDEKLDRLMEKYFPQGGQTLIHPQPDWRPRVPSPLYDEPFAEGGAVEYHADLGPVGKLMKGVGEHLKANPTNKITEKKMFEPVANILAKDGTVLESDLPLEEARRLAPSLNGMVSISRPFNKTPSFPHLVVPGGSNYRESLLSLPERGEGRPIANVKSYDDLIKYGNDMRDWAASGENYFSPNWNMLDQIGKLRGAHADNPNVVGHLRMQDRRGPDGSRMLHLEDLNSDWGRDLSAGKTSVTGPYVGDQREWTDLLLGHTMKEAAAGNYDRLLITPGKEQAERGMIKPWQSGYFDTTIPERLDYMASGVKPFGYNVPGYGPVHSLDLTPGVKESWMNQSNYAEGGPVHMQEGGALSRLARLAKGKPATVKLPGGEIMDAHPIREFEDVAKKFADRYGNRYPIESYPALDEDRARKIAQAYEEMQHNPYDPRVKRAYEAMIDETMDQYRALEGTGAKFEFHKPGEGDPYARSPSLGYKDLVENGRLKLFPTDNGYGTQTDISDNPLLRRVGRVGDLDNATANDAFRVVHDALGHFGPGNPFFRAPGEERAWLNHMRAYSPDAVPAATSETRGQNSWVNFGPRALENKGKSGADTIYADQKAGLLPEWMYQPEGHADGGPIQHFQKSGIVRDAAGAALNSWRTRRAQALEAQVKSLNRGVDDRFISPDVDPKLQTVTNPLRIVKPLIYADPRDVTSMAREAYAPDLGKDSPLYNLFGHTRHSLDELARSNKPFDIPRPNTGDFSTFLPPEGGTGSRVSSQVTTPRNANRILDVLGLGLEDPDLKTMRSWYEISPMWEHMKSMGLPDRDARVLNTRMGVMSPQASPDQEVARGFLANYLAKNNRLEDFGRYGGARPPGESMLDLPSDLQWDWGHKNHQGHMKGLMENEFTGRVWPGSRNKVQAYIGASDPVLPLFNMPVADSHFTRSIGLPDVRTSRTPAVLAANMSNPEYADIAPWWNRRIAQEIDEYPRDAQALSWGMFGPATGVRKIGLPKLEIIANHMDEVGRHLGIDPKLARDRLLSGEIGGFGNTEAPFAGGGPVDDFDTEYVGQYFAEGGSVDDDMLAYQSQFYAGGGPVGYFGSSH